MGSRVRSTPSTLLECWCEVVVGQGPDQPPWIIHKFPSTFDDQQTLNSIPQFVFPCKIETSVVLNFSFVLTSLDSKFTFGFCRHSPNAESALVVLSYLPWDSTFYKILNMCSELQSSDSPDDVWSFLKTLYTAPVPDPGSDLTLTYPPANKMFVTRCPNHLSLPSLPDNRNLLEYINAVSPETMMVMFASLLFERRIMISSKHLHRVSACVQAANALLYPMSWQHIYIPILPEPLLDYLLAPMPFLIGVPDILMQKVHLDEVRDVVYLNADTNVINTPFRDLAELPNDVCSHLRRKLSEPGQGMGDSVPRAFLKALVMLIGNYREALQFNEEDRKVFFNTELFVASRPQHLQPFVKKMLELQIFRQFIEEREDQENRGVATSDEFEMEVSVYCDRPRKHYHQLMHAVKKEGGAIVKNFKSKASAGKNKTNARKRSTETGGAPSKAGGENEMPKSTKGQGEKEAATGGSKGSKGWKRGSRGSKSLTSQSSGDADGEGGESQSLNDEKRQSGTSAATAQEVGRTTNWFAEAATIDVETNPAVKSAVKSVSKSSKQVRERGAEKYKEFRGKMKLPTTRSPEHVPWTPADADDRSPPPSPPSRLPTNRPNMEVTAKVSYKRPLPNHVNRSDGVGVPSSVSASSFRSPDSPGHTPAPHTIDLVGELEQELINRLSEPNSLSGRPSLSTPFSSTNQPTVNGSRRRSVSRPTTLPPPVPSAIPPPAASRAHTTLGSAARDKESPSTQGLSGTKDRDLILLGSPQEEEFDPLLRSSYASQKRGNSIPSSTMASLPAALQNHLANQLNKTPPVKLYKDLGARTNESSFVPFSTHFQSTNTIPPTAQANPLYNSHELVLGDKLKPQSSSYPKSTSSSYTSVMTSSYSSATRSLPLPATSAHSLSITSSATQAANPSLANSNSFPKPNFAAAFASTMINNSPGVRPATPNINNNNNVDEPKMLGSFSESFAQMKLNKSGDNKGSATAESQPPSVAEHKPTWTSFE